MDVTITKADVRSAVAWFAAALALYLATGARGLVWADSSKLTLYALAGYFPSLNPGDHAGWTLLASAWLHLFGGDPIVAAHRLSAFAGAVCVALVGLVIRARGGDRERAATGAALLLVALPVWWAATAAETYPVALALTLGGAAVLMCSKRGWRWWIAGAAWGVALASHALTVFVIVPLALEAAGPRLAWRLLPGAFVGAAPVWLAFFGAPPDPLTSFAASGSASWRWHWEAFVALASVPRGLGALAALLLYGCGVLGMAALWRGRREPRGGATWAVSLGALTLLLVTYAPYRLHLMAAFLIVGGLLALPTRLGTAARAAHIAIQALTYIAVPAALTITEHQSLGVRTLPYRANAFYFLCPIKGLPAATAGWGPAALFDPGTERYLGAVGECAPLGATVLGDFNPGAPLRLAQVVRCWRSDLRVQPVAIDVALGAENSQAALAAEIGRALERGPVMLADTYRPYYRLDELEARFVLAPCRAGALVRAPAPDTHD